MSTQLLIWVITNPYDAPYASRGTLQLQMRLLLLERPSYTVFSLRYSGSLNLTHFCLDRITESRRYGMGQGGGSRQEERAVGEHGRNMDGENLMCSSHNESSKPLSMYYSRARHTVLPLCFILLQNIS
jgi:hypothetical protein